MRSEAWGALTTGDFRDYTSRILDDAEIRPGGRLGAAAATRRVPRHHVERIGETRDIQFELVRDAGELESRIAAIRARFPVEGADGVSETKSVP